MQPNVAPPPYGPAFSPLPPAAVAAGPALGSDPQAGPPGEATGFADLGVRGAEDGFFGGGMHPRDSARYSTIWFPTVPVHGQASDFQMLGEDLSLSHPLWVDPLNALSLTGGIRNRLIDTEAVLPDTGQAIPADLWSVHLGLRYARQLNDGWITGGGVSIGSASDHPFAGIREMDVGMNALLRVPRGEHDAWMFTLMYSPTGELNFPVPGIAYSYNPSPQFHANIGLPLQVVWRPTDAWQFQATYMLLRTVHCKAEYRISQRLRLCRLRLVERGLHAAGPARGGRPLLHLRPAGEHGLGDLIFPPLDGLGLGRLHLRPLYVPGHLVRLQQFGPRGPGGRAVPRPEYRRAVLGA